MTLPSVLRGAALLSLAALLAACPKSDSKSAGPAVSDPVVRGDAPPPPPDIRPEPQADSKTLSVVAARPKGVLVGLNRPTVTFNKPVVALGTLEQGDQTDQSHGIRLEPKAEGAWHWLGSGSVEFVPAAQLPYSTEYHDHKRIDNKTLSEVWPNIS